MKFKHNKQNLLVGLVRVALGDSRIDHELFTQLENTDWNDLFLMSRQQGLSAIILDGIEKLPQYARPCQKLVLAWAGVAIKIETRWEQQRKTAERLAEIWRENGIRVMLLKGLSLSRYYPIPNHRESGDIDVYLFGDYNKGNLIAERELNAKIDKFNTKEDHILVSGCQIDNHITFCWTGSKDGMLFDEELKHMLTCKNLEMLPDTQLLVPPDEFCYLFLIQHSYSHFMREGMPFRHLTDLVCFLTKRYRDMDWDSVNQLLEKYHLKKFSDALITLIEQNFQIKIPVGGRCSSKLADRMLADILSSNHPVVYHTSKWKHWQYMLYITWHNRWKFQCFCKGGFSGYFTRKIFL